MSKAREIRDSCQLTCICKTCGNEQGGVCALGSCESAREMDRCPLTECHYCVGGKVTTIADKARELREAFREQYGVEVDIQIYIYGLTNPQINKETAEKLGREMAAAIGHAKHEHRNHDTSQWYLVEDDTTDLRISLFYEKEEGASEQSN